MYWVLSPVFRWIHTLVLCAPPPKKKALFCKSEKRSTDIGDADHHLLLMRFISAPSGYLEWWMKFSGDPVTKQVNIHLFWKVRTQDKFVGFRGTTYSLIKTLWSTLKMYPSFCFFFLSGLQMVSCQQPECFLRRVSAKAVRWKSTAVLHKLELLYFSASRKNSKAVFECCKCSWEIQPY